MRKDIPLLCCFLCMILLLLTPFASNAQNIQSVQISPSSVTPAGGQMPAQPVIQPIFSTSKSRQVTEQLRRETEQVQVVPQSRPSVETVSKFEQFIAGGSVSSISTELKQFGYDFFKDAVSSPVSENVPVGPDYVVGPGDGINITVWGKVEGSWDAAVDRDGNINLPKIGVLGVTGLTFNQLKELLYKEFSKYYTGFEMNVSMGSLRTIRVYVVGNALNPGAYTLSSLSTLVNALFQSGGPGKTGTLRDIQLKRNGQTIQHFDMYDFLLKGDKSKDLRLMPEDVIFIPPVGPMTGIAGNVRSPAIYELRGETRLMDIITMAGGLTSVAFKGRVQFTRIEDHSYRSLFEGDLLNIENNAAKNFVLQDGDLIKVFAVQDTKNTVALTGAVANAGDYGIVPGVTKLKDVISLAGGLMYYASSKTELTRVKVTPSGPQTEQIVLDAFKVIADDPAHNIPLQINDYILIRTVPDWELYQTVTVSGEVQFPGTYTVIKGEKLSSLLERAGGYTDRAYLKAAEFTRIRVRESQQRSLDEMSSRLEKELIIAGAQQVSSAISGSDVEAEKVEIEQKKRFIESLKQLKAKGRMSIKLSHIRLLKNSEFDIELENGDVLFIPTKNNVVNVVGSVMSNGSFIYSEAFDYLDYIGLTGGYTQYADEKNIYVLKVDGTAQKLSDGLLNWNMPKSRWEVSALAEDVKGIGPGDTVVVPEKLDRIAWLREIKDITQIMSQIAVTAGIVLLY